MFNKKSQKISKNLKLDDSMKNKGAKPPQNVFFCFFFMFFDYILHVIVEFIAAGHLSFRDSQDAAASFAEPVGNDDHNINIFIEAHLCRFPHRWNRNISYIEFCFLWCF